MAAGPTCRPGAGSSSMSRSMRCPTPSAASSGRSGSRIAISRRSITGRKIRCSRPRARRRSRAMNLHRLLLERQAAGKPLRVGLIGAGKFGTMFVASARTTAGLHLAAIADLDPARAKESLLRTNWPAEQADAPSIDAALKSGRTFLTDDAAKLFAAPLDVIIEATGNPAAGIAHALAAFKAGKSVVMVNVEADAVAGPLLARRAAEAGVVYSLAYGDQPALICEMVDWARAAGFPVTAAGKGTKYLPAYHQSTPETVWGHYGITAERA